MLLIPILTRLYLPEEMGLSGAFIATVLTLAVGINGGYEMAIMLPKEEKEALKIKRLSLFMATTLALLALIVAILVGELGLTQSKFSALYGWHLLLPVSLWLEGLTQALRFWLNRQQAYRFLSLGKIANALVRNGFCVLLGYQFPFFWVLILAFILGQVANLLPILWGIWKAKTAIFPIRWKEISPLFIEYQDFTRFGILSAWLNQAAKQLPIFILPLFYSLEIEGWYIHADKVLMIPMLVAVTVGEVYYQQATAAAQESDATLWALTQKTTLLLLGLAFFPTLILMIGGVPLFAYLFGKHYAMAGEYAQWLAPVMFMMFLASPLSYLIDIRRKLNYFLFYNLFAFFIRILVLYPACKSYPILTTLKIYSATSCVLILFQLAYLLHLAYQAKN